MRTVEGHGSGIGAHRLLDDVHPGALRPDGELLHGRGAEGIGGADHDLLALGRQHRRELADRSGLPHPVRAHDEHHIRLLGEVEGLHGGVVLIDIEQFPDLVADEVHELVHRHILVLLHPIFQILNHFEGGIHAHVRRQERLFEGVQHVIVHLGLAHDGPSQFLEEVHVGLLDPLVENTHLSTVLVICKYNHFNGIYVIPSEAKESKKSGPP